LNHGSEGSDGDGIGGNETCSGTSSVLDFDIFSSK